MKFMTLGRSLRAGALAAGAFVATLAAPAQAQICADPFDSRGATEIARLTALSAEQVCAAAAEMLLLKHDLEAGACVASADGGKASFTRGEDQDELEIIVLDRLGQGQTWIKTFDIQFFGATRFLAEIGGARYQRISGRLMYFIGGVFDGDQTRCFPYYYVDMTLNVTSRSLYSASKDVNSPAWRAAAAREEGDFLRFRDSVFAALAECLARGEC